MYIEICQDVVNDALLKGSHEVNDSLDLLYLFAIFSAQGRHIVVVPCLRDKPTREKLSMVLGVSNVEKLRRSERKSYMLPQIKAAVSAYCIVSYSQQPNNDDRAIIINPEKLKNFEPYLETRLITENLLDARFFDFIGNFYLRQSHLTGIKLNYDPIPGGGSTTCDVVKKEIVDYKRFCLVIVDSDRKYPMQEEYGETAEKVKEVMDNYPSPLCKLYVMEKVMEVENLIPKRIVIMYASDKTSRDILDRDFSFFDMKSGITLKGLYNDEVFRYWETQLQGGGLVFSHRNEAKTNTSNKDDYERYIEDHDFENVIKKGFGANLLSIVTCTGDRKGKIKYPKLLEVMKNEIRLCDLTLNQQEEWLNIGRFIYSWTCGLSSRIA